jgi:hypothetical protein
MDIFEEEMDIDEPPIKVLISEDMCRDKSHTGSMYADKVKNSSIHSRLNQPPGNGKHLPNSAKMDGAQLKNNIDVESNPDTLDLRQKLKSRKQRLDAKTLPSLSIEITEDW